VQERSLENSYGKKDGASPWGRKGGKGHRVKPSTAAKVIFPVVRALGWGGGLKDNNGRGGGGG